MIKRLFRSAKGMINKYFETSVHSALRSLPNNGAVTLIDIGAAGDIEPRWKPYSRYLKYIGFEPDERSREKLNATQTHFLNYSIYPFALADANKNTSLFLCRGPQQSSLFLPNRNFLKNFPNVERFDVINTEAMPVVSLDSLRIPDSDFIKMDIQGAELDVLKGADVMLDSLFGLELEVEFLQLYQKQPLFGEICAQLSDRGFEFVDFVNLARWERKSFNSFGQCVFGDALFLKAPEALDIDNLDVAKISSYLAILVIYRRYDLIRRVFELLPEKHFSTFSSFKLEIPKIERQNRFVRAIVAIADKCVSLLGSSYRIHLIY